MASTLKSLLAKHSCEIQQLGALICPGSSGPLMAAIYKNKHHVGGPAAHLMKCVFNLIQGPLCHNPQVMMAPYATGRARASARLNHLSKAPGAANLKLETAKHSKLRAQGTIS